MRGGNGLHHEWTLDGEYFQFWKFKSAKISIFDAKFAKGKDLFSHFDKCQLEWYNSMEIFHRYNSEILRHPFPKEERIRREGAKCLSCPASLTAMPFSFSSESSSHLVLPHRYSMIVRANVTRPVVGSISLSRGLTAAHDGVPSSRRHVANNCLPARRACVSSRGDPRETMAEESLSSWSVTS